MAIRTVIVKSYQPKPTVSKEEYIGWFIGGCAAMGVLYVILCA